MGRNRQFILAIIVGLIAIVVAMNLKPKDPKPQVGPGVSGQPEVVKQVKVYTARDDLKPGTRLSAAMLMEKELPEAEAPGDAFQEIKDVGKYEVAAPVEAGAVVLKRKLKEMEPIKGLSMVIPSGKRAMTIEVDKISGVGGFIQQGDRVDVIGIFTKGSNLPFNEPVKTILAGVEVLSIGQEMSAGYDAAPASGAAAPPPPGKGGEATANKITAKVVPYVTIAVTPDEAEILTLVREKARFSLLLRSSKDDELSTDEVELMKKETLTRNEALMISKDGSAAPARPGFGAPPVRPGDDLFAPGGTNPGLSPVRPTSIGPRPLAKKKPEKAKTYQVEMRKGTQDPRTVTVQD